MVNSEEIFKNLISLLDVNGVVYKLFSHRPALTYEDLAAVQKETGFIGTEGKCMVLKTDEKFIVYITIQGKRVNFDKIKEFLSRRSLGLVGSQAKATKGKGASPEPEFTEGERRASGGNVVSPGIKVRLATKEELKEFFYAEPGCAYPFGFDEKIDIYVDPIIYEQEWFLFSPVVPSKTVQAKGVDLKKVFGNLKNKVTEVREFNM